MINIGASFIMDNFGENEESGEMGFCYFEELLDQLMRFDFLKWTRYDTVVAFCLAAIAARVSKKDAIPKYSVKDWFRVKK
jgi:hypothetical protein